MAAIRLDPDHILRYAHLGRRVQIAAEDIEDIHIIIRLSIRHPFVLGLFAVGLLYPLLLLYQLADWRALVMRHTASLLFAPIIGLYLAYRLVTARRIPWLIVRRAGRVIELPLPGHSQDALEQLIEEIDAIRRTS